MYRIASIVAILMANVFCISASAQPFPSAFGDPFPLTGIGIGGVYNSTLPTLAVGKLSPFQFDVNGRLLILLDSTSTGYLSTIATASTSAIPACATNPCTSVIGGTTNWGTYNVLGTNNLYTPAINPGNQGKVPVGKYGELDVGFDGESVSPPSLQTATVTFTSASPTVVTWTTNGLAVGAPVLFINSGGSLPTGIVSGQTYYACIVATNSIHLSTTLANAIAATCDVNTSSTGTGTQTGVNEVLFVQDMTAFEAINVQVDAAGSSTLSYEQSETGVNWYPVSGMSASSTNSNPVTTTTTTGITSFVKAGHNFRVRASSYASGPVTVSYGLSKVAVQKYIGQISVSASASLAANTTGGGLTYSATGAPGNALLTNTAVLISSGPHTLYALDMFESASTSACIQIFDAATSGSVTLGVTPPKLSYCMTASSSCGTRDPNLPAVGVSFSNGIVVAGTTTGAGSTAPSTGIQANFHYE